VIKCDEDKQRLGFSLKASNFVDDDDSEEETSDEEEESSKEKMYVMSSDNESSSEKESNQSIDSDDENYVAKMASKMETHDDTEDESDTGSESDGNSEEDSESESNEPGQSIVDAMDTNVGFEWDTSAKPSAKIKSTEESADESDSSSSTDSSDDDNDDDNDDADVGFKSSHKSRKKAAARRKEEEEISRREVALADGTADDNPETTADFERLVASSPNNSETWIKYMAFHLSLADIESARSVANRAFDRIQFRQEGEKVRLV
jgi:rRNA biogenesis protein RRP5